MKSNVYTIPPGEPFLERLSRAILNGDLPAPGSAQPDPLSLPDVTLLLPTRRATRALQEAFLAASGARALLMPRIQPISEGEEDLTLLSGLAGLTSLGSAAIDLPPAVTPLERTLTLMQLVLLWRAKMAEADPDEMSAGRQHAGAGGGPCQRTREPDGHDRDRERRAVQHRQVWCRKPTPHIGRRPWSFCAS